MYKEELLVYDQITQDPVIDQILEDINYLNNDVIQHRFMASLLRVAEAYDLHDHLIQSLLTYLLAMHENAFSLSLERNVDVPAQLKTLVMHDLSYFFDLYKNDLNDLTFDNKAIVSDYMHSRPIINKEIFDLLSELQNSLASATTVDEFYSILLQHYGRYGVGRYGLNKAFRLDDENKIVPITHIDDNTLEQLIGYESHKQQLTANTEAFLKGKKANNVLLYGDNGTGKSSSIKALLNRYYKDGLRMIEIYKHQFQQLPYVINELQNRNYKFIIFMDDLSFEEYETEYKYLKAVIEGGLEKKPDNILIYATSNRRHLIKETWNERNTDEINKNDTIQEKTSLVSRFGLQILYMRPNRKDFLSIVDGLAKQYNIDMDQETLHARALEWEIRNGGFTGRVAKQFINKILGE
ncbi:MAG: ATP-binding protein [Erysipelotrichaceae bacterium]|nr:ATP-binding protein [Erysipelotrichaceae bacterium]